MPLSGLITIGLMAVVTVGLIVWDIIVAVNNIPNSLDTISGRMKAYGKQALILPWAWAVLFGHFWGPIKSGQLMSMRTSMPILIFSTWIVLILSIYLRQIDVSITSSWILFFLILNIGAFFGAILWPQ